MSENDVIQGVVNSGIHSLAGVAAGGLIDSLFFHSKAIEEDLPTSLLYFTGESIMLGVGIMTFFQVFKNSNDPLMGAMFVSPLFLAVDNYRVRCRHLGKKIGFYLNDSVQHVEEALEK